MKPKAIFLAVNPILVNRVYVPEVIGQFKEHVELDSSIIIGENVSDYIDVLKDVRYILSTWGMPSLPEEKIRNFFPSLKVVFYAAGSVQDFARPFINCGVKVSSAWGANAVPVAEYTAAQIILAGKGFYQATSKTRIDYKNAREYCDSYPGNYHTNVGILGAGMIGSKVIELLKPYKLNIFVFDPFLTI